MEKEKIKEALFKAGFDARKVLNYIGIDTNHKNTSKMVLCPFHEDGTPSMLINDDDTVHCFACGFHLDSIQLYAALKYDDVDSGKDIWESSELTNILTDLIEALNLELNVDIDEGCIRNEIDDFFSQIKENTLDIVCDSLYVRNHLMSDLPFQPLNLHAKSIYIYKDPKTKNPLAIKVRYEDYIGENFEKILFVKKGKEFVEHSKVTSESIIKRKSFRFYDINEGKVVKGSLPENKKEIIYNGERVLEISNDNHKRNTSWIWFVEGEKDVETLKEYGIIGCSLMKGSNSNWIKEYNEVFRGCKVIIASDFDEAGQKYEETLFQSLFYGNYVELVDGKEEKKSCAIGLKKMNKKFYEINKMPHKSDITDLIEKWKSEGATKIDIVKKLNEIIERSIDYKDDYAVAENDYGIYNKKKKIADFIVEDAINIISTDKSQSDKIQLKIRGIGAVCKDNHTRVANIHEMFGSVDAFNKTFSVMDCTFIGSKDELFKLKKFILNYKMFHSRFMYSINGMFKHQGEWITVTPYGSLRKDGTFDKDIFSSNEIMYNDLENIIIPDKEKINNVVPALLGFNTKEIVYNVLGEIGCKLLNSRYKEIGVKNHLFQLNGSKGAGKTETSVKVIATITNNNTRGEYNLTGQSNFTFLKNITANNIGGMILQELKLGKMSEYDKNRWSEIFRNNYDRARSQRGTKDQELNQYDQNNPIITTGEEGIGEESALFERFNIIHMTAETRKSNPRYGENFRMLCDNQDTLRGIGKQLIIDIMNLTDKEIKDSRQEIEVKIRNKGLDKKGFVDRILNNAINVIHGLIILGDTLRKLGFTEEFNVEEGFDTIIDNFLENVLRVNDGKANDDYQQMLIQYQKALDTDYNDKVVHEASNAYYVYDKCLWISINKLRIVINSFVQDSRSGVTILSENEFRKNLVKAGYISENNTHKKKFNHSKAKGWYYKVDITIMKKLDLSFIDDLISRGEVIDPDEFLNPEKKSDVVPIAEMPYF